MKKILLIVFTILFFFGCKQTTSSSDDKPTFDTDPYNIRYVNNAKDSDFVINSVKTYKRQEQGTGLSKFINYCYFDIDTKEYYYNTGSSYLDHTITLDFSKSVYSVAQSNGGTQFRKYKLDKVGNDFYIVHLNDELEEISRKKYFVSDNYFSFE